MGNAQLDPFTVDSVQVTYRRCAADDGGAVFIQSAADYMRYGIVEELLEETDFYKRIAEQSQWVSQFIEPNRQLVGGTV